MCTKLQHANREGAERHLAQLEQRDRRRGFSFRPGRLQVYVCPECSAAAEASVWHVGHSSRKRKDTV